MATLHATKLETVRAVGLEIGQASTSRLNTSASKLSTPRSTAKSVVEPDVFHPPGAEDVVDVDRQALHAGLQAGPAGTVIDDRPGVVRGQLVFDGPQQLLAAVGIGLDIFDICGEGPVALALFIPVAFLLLRHLPSRAWVATFLRPRLHLGGHAAQTGYAPKSIS